MTQDEIIEMARQTGLVPVLENVRLGDKGVLATDCIEAFAKLVAAKEREACMELCEDADSYYAIRARGEA